MIVTHQYIKTHNLNIIMGLTDRWTGRNNIDIGKELLRHIITNFLSTIYMRLLPLPHSRLIKHISLILLVLPLMHCQTEPPALHGYIEGEFIMISPTTSGILEELYVEEGQYIEKKHPLFSLNLIELNAEYLSAQANLKKAQAQYNDLTKGERPEEIRILIKQKEQAIATMKNAREEYDRNKALVTTGAVSIAARDQAKADLKTAAARLEEIDAKITAAHLGARVDTIIAAQANITIAKQHLILTEKKLQDAAPRAPINGTIEEVYFRPGEYISAGQPVVTLLPLDNIKIRFFVSQEQVASLQQKQQIIVTCDGCPNPIKATISYIASEAEYTPPVIYSVESRQKLVFLIEAIPTIYQPNLKPGLPVDINLNISL